MLIFCACCNKETEHDLQRVGLELILPCLEVEGDEVCGHVVKFPKTRDIAELGQWITEHNKVNVIAVLPKEVSEDMDAMDELIKQFVPIKE